MQTVQHNMALAESAGYPVLGTRTLPREAWVEGYYDLLQPRLSPLRRQLRLRVLRAAARLGERFLLSPFGGTACVPACLLFRSS
jgi:hypothetical protein